MRKNILHHGLALNMVKDILTIACAIKFGMNMKAFEQKQAYEKIKVWNFNDPEG